MSQNLIITVEEKKKKNYSNISLHLDSYTLKELAFSSKSRGEILIPPKSEDPKWKTAFLKLQAKKGASRVAERLYTR